MKTTLIPLEPKKNLNSYLTQTFSFTECLRKKHTGHRFFLLCEKNEVFSNPHGPTILKIKKITVYMSNTKKEQQAGMILCSLMGFLFTEIAPLFCWPITKRVQYDFFSQSRTDGFELVQPHTLAWDMIPEIKMAWGWRRAQSSAPSSCHTGDCACLSLRYSTKINHGHK